MCERVGEREMKKLLGFQYGELVLAFRPNGNRVLIKLKEGGNFSQVCHEEIVASDTTFYTSVNGCIFRRPSLEEYVVLMDRIPAPTYPKDAQAMASMLDLGEGSCVVEAGSGSGGLTLQLSKSVGMAGQVFTFESSSRHMRAALSNYQQWCANWMFTRHSVWPDNVKFTETSVAEVQSHVALDLKDPGPLLPHLLPIIKPSGLVALYLPNITQFTTLLGHIHSEHLPLELEKVVEVIHREWVVKPAASKHPRLASMAEEATTKYICRPSHHQLPHTAFLGLLRRLPPSKDS